MRFITKAALAITFTLSIAIPLPAEGQSAPIEPNATIDPDLRSETIPAIVSLIRNYGYRCDSVSAVIKHVFSRGFSVTCNRYNYEYELEDRGGNWVVCYEKCD